MNASFLSRILNVQARLCSVAACAVLASASVLAPARPAIFLPVTLDDPLRTSPVLLNQGRSLPGDREQVPCLTTSPSNNQLSLVQAVDLALCSSAKVRSTWLGIKVQAAALGGAKAVFFPTLSANIGRQRTLTGYAAESLPDSSVSGNVAYASLSWRLFDFGNRVAEREAANFLLLAAIQSHDAMLQKTMEDTVQAYFDTLTARANLQAKEEGVQIASATLDSAKRRESSGAAARGDTLQALTAYARASLERNRALGNYRKATAVLTYAVGLPADVPLVLADIDTGTAKVKSPLEPAEQEHGLGGWLQEAKRSHPSILAARSKWDAALSTAKAARMANLPTVDLAANYYKNGYPNQGLSATSSHVGTIGISISFPIFSGFSRYYNLRQVEAIAQQRQADLDDTEREVSTELVKAYATTQSAHDSLDASAQLLDAALEALASSQRKYAKGAGDIREVLYSQRDLADAKEERVRTVGEWRLARLRLMTAAGQLNQRGIATADSASMPLILSQ